MYGVIIGSSMMISHAYYVMNYSSSSLSFTIMIAHRSYHTIYHAFIRSFRFPHPSIYHIHIVHMNVCRSCYISNILIITQLSCHSSTFRSSLHIHIHTNTNIRCHICIHHHQPHAFLSHLWYRSHLTFMSIYQCHDSCPSIFPLCHCSGVSAV